MSLNKIIASIFIFIAVLVISGYKSKGKIKLGKFEALILISSIFYTLAATIDNYLVNQSDAITYLSFSFLVAGTIMTLSNVGRLSKHKLMLKDKDFWKLLILNCLFVVISYWGLFTAYKMGGEVSKLYPITHTQTVLVPILGVVFLGEKVNLKRKIIALLITIFAFYLLKP